MLHPGASVRQDVLYIGICPAIVSLVTWNRDVGIQHKKAFFALFNSDAKLNLSIKKVAAVCHYSCLIQVKTFNGQEGGSIYNLHWESAAPTFTSNVQALRRFPIRTPLLPNPTTYQRPAEGSSQLLSMVLHLISWSLCRLLDTCKSLFS